MLWAVVERAYVGARNNKRDFKLPEPFKNFFNPEMIDEMAGHLARVSSDFDRAGFVAFAIEGIEDRELKERSNRIVQALGKFLPDDFPTALTVLIDSLDPAMDLPIDASGEQTGAAGNRGWAIMPMADYIARSGQGHVAISLAALKELTSRYSSEFAIRPFLQNHTEETLRIMAGWLDDSNEHVRRLVSEGSRPRLPWGMRLHGFCENPAPVIALLEQLKDDDSKYVRRSVANNLNDIAKDHPDLVAELANEWIKDASTERARLIKHALRSLIKAGHAGALGALGYRTAKIELVEFSVLTPEVAMGGALEFALEISSAAKVEQPLIIDYAIHHRRANGSTSPKVFKWKNVTLKAGKTLAASKRHSIKPITTRRYYAGQHRVEISVNGEAICAADFDLTLD